MNKIIKNKKKCRTILIFSILVVFTSQISLCQTIDYMYSKDYIILDSVYMEVIYETKKSIDTTNSSLFCEETQILQIGKNISKMFSYTTFQTDSTIYEYIKRNESSYPSGNLYLTTYEIYKNYKTDTLDFFDRSQTEVFLYHEKIPKIAWKIQNDKKTIVGYSCQKATAEFRGRVYEAWFAADIPIFEGPYKFTGLPGLILEIYDTKKHYEYTCVGLRLLTDMNLIARSNWKKTSTISRKRHAILVKQYYDNPFWLAYQLGCTIGIKIDNKVVKNPKDFKLFYNPIELE